jgi:ATP-dependent exoDNAse (exonuclease V) beta subunit
MKPLADAEARRAIREDLDTTLVVEAAAGTGKTTELVQRILALLVTGTTTLSRIVAVTFTEKAAGEMKLRLRTEIERARNAAETTATERTRLDAALEELEAAHIGTIHGFCAEILRHRPVEARVDPLFETLDEDARDRLFEEAFERWFQETLADPPEGVRRVLRRRRSDRDSGPKDVLRRAGLSLVDQRDFRAMWRRDPFDRDASLDALVQRFREVAQLDARIGTSEAWIAKSLAEIAHFVAELDHRESVRQRDADGLERELRAFARARHWNWKGGPNQLGGGVTRAVALATRDAAKNELESFLDRADADLAACLYRDLSPLVDAYEDLKRRAGKLDFLDLLAVARDLVRDDDAVRRELQSRYSHLLVDEFQDTDPLQADILLLLAADDSTERDAARATPRPGKLFIVGDPKQSIYRFRRADVALYEQIKRRLVAHGARCVHLTTSFRSIPSIQSAVNASFAAVMKGNAEGSQAEYVALQPFRDDHASQPGVVVLPVPRPYSPWGKVTNYAIDQSYPDAVGAFVEWLVRDSNWTVSEPGGKRVRIEARHVCLLFRRFVAWRDDATRPYVRALEARRIPHVLVGGRSFHAREEVLALRNVANALEWPDDDFSVFATLRGPFFALGDDALLAYRATHGSLHPLRRIDETQLDALTQPVADALAILAKLHVGRNTRPIADTLGRFLEETRAFAGVAIWPSGEQALANVSRVLDQARRFEARGATSFRAFVRRIEDESERNAAGEAPVVEEGTDGVRLMTVHRAKGLEFPIVILVDPTCATASDEPSRYIDAAKGLWARPLAGCSPIELLEHRDEVLRHDAEEAVRLTYVAATRAKDLLVLPAVGDEAINGWLDVMNPAIYPAPGAWRDSVAAPGCPRFGDDSVKERTAEARTSTDNSVRPGLVRPMAGEHGVVWWDPSVLDLGRELVTGLRQTRILREDDSDGAARGREEHNAWRGQRERAIDAGRRESLRIATVTQRRRDRPDDSHARDELRIERTVASREGGRLGRRFGALVHRVLAAAPLDANEITVRTLAVATARAIGASTAEADLATVRVSSALAHPLLVAARALPDALRRRECDLSVILDDGSRVEGTLDLAYRDGNAEAPWIVVEFKTDLDAVSDAQAAEYGAQLALYRLAIEKATGERARGVLLGV